MNRNSQKSFPFNLSQKDIKLIASLIDSRAIKNDRDPDDKNLYLPATGLEGWVRWNDFLMTREFLLRFLDVIRIGYDISINWTKKSATISMLDGSSVGKSNMASFTCYSTNLDYPCPLNSAVCRAFLIFTEELASGKG